MNSQPTEATNMIVAHHIRVGIADDHPVVRMGLRHELSRHADIEVVGEAVDGDGVLRLVQKLDIHVLLLDLSMPGMASFDIMRSLMNSVRPPRVLIVSAYDRAEQVLAMLKAGATGYMVKDEDPSVIATAVRTVAHGKTWMSASVMATLVDHSIKEHAKPAKPILSAREVDVLQHLADGKDNCQIGQALDISERTVRFHLRNIYDKLQLRRGETIAWSISSGLATPNIHPNQSTRE